MADGISNLDTSFSGPPTTRYFWQISFCVASALLASCFEDMSHVNFLFPWASGLVCLFQNNTDNDFPFYEQCERLKKQLEKTKKQKEKLESLCRSLQAERKQNSAGSSNSDSAQVWKVDHNIFFPNIFLMVLVVVR